MKTDKPLTRRARQRLETRLRIVEAAVSTFAERGFHGASMREIAGRCGVTQGLVTYHFQNKDTLWRAAADHLFGGIASDLRARVGPQPMSTPRALARAVVRAYVMHVAERPELMRFIVQEGSVDDDRVSWLVDTHIRPMYQAFGGLMTAGGVAGEALPVEHLYYVMAGAGSLMFTVRSTCMRVAGIDPAEPAVIERHADLVARLLVPDL